MRSRRSTIGTTAATRQPATRALDSPEPTDAPQQGGDGGPPAAATAGSSSSVDGTTSGD